MCHVPYEEVTEPLSSSWSSSILGTFPSLGFHKFLQLFHFIGRHDCLWFSSLVYPISSKRLFLCLAQLSCHLPSSDLSQRETPVKWKILIFKISYLIMGEENTVFQRGVLKVLSWWVLHKNNLCSFPRASSPLKKAGVPDTRDDKQLSN